MGLFIFLESFFEKFCMCCLNFKAIVIYFRSPNSIATMYIPGYYFIDDLLILLFFLMLHLVSHELTINLNQFNDLQILSIPSRLWIPPIGNWRAKIASPCRPVWIWRQTLYCSQAAIVRAKKRYINILFVLRPCKFPLISNSFEINLRDLLKFS